MKNEIKKRIAILQKMECIIETVESMKLANCEYDDEGNAKPPKEDNWRYHDYLAYIEIEKMLQDLTKKI